MDLERLERIDKLKTKMLKYIFYKKRSEKEVREKFKNEENDGKGVSKNVLAQQ